MNVRFDARHCHFANRFGEVPCKASLHSLQAVEVAEVEVETVHADDAHFGSVHFAVAHTRGHKDNSTCWIVSLN